MSGTDREERDPVVAGALRSLHAPDHGEDFWTRLDARLASVPAPRPSSGPSAPVAVTRDPDRAGDRAADGDDATVVSLLDPEHRRRAPRWRGPAVAAVVVALVGLAATLRISAERDQSVDVTTPPAGVTTSTAAPGTVPSTTLPRGTGADATTPDGAVLRWLDAVGAGDIDGAKALTGPRTTAYFGALGVTVDGFLTEAGEGYGGWAGVGDRTTTEVDLGTVAGQEITVVVVSGTWRGEGEDGFRHDAIPAVRGADGRWLVEPAAFNRSGGRLEVLSPPPGEESGLGGLAPEGFLEAAAPGRGTFWFSLDDAPPTQVAGQPATAGVRGRFDPPGDLPSQTHLLVVAYVDRDTITAFAGTFLVEG